ncbi:DUF805 domain-containing protein [Arthrobacter sp. H14]|uniref:DUF805 domain-containing protein n=1 Tax=Arthrobacter sp. H14 TaxID=1312959 RepID=UPI0004AE3BA9|nr:DUF805 domain-containing protein [Arthrobacter sp. H14]
MTYPSMYPSYGYPVDAPLNQPQYGASFGASIKRFFTKYATFSGRASRSEYWWAFLFNTIVITVLYIAAIAFAFAGADPVTGEPGAAFLAPLVLLSIYGLAVLIPNIAVTVRRLHDANFSGFMYLFSFIPFVGGLVVLVLTLMPANPEGARFDEYPPQYPGNQHPGQYPGQNPGQYPQGYTQTGYPGQPGV